MSDHPVAHLDIEVVSVSGFAFEDAFYFPQTPPRVFVALYNEIDRWWTDRFRERTRCQIEGHVGGRWMQEWDSGGALLGTVIVFDPPHLLRMAGQLAMSKPAHNVVDFLLEPLPDGTRLVLRHRCVGEIEAGSEESYQQGWKELLGKSLFDYVAADVVIAARTRR